MKKELKIVGKRVKRPDAMAKATGQIQFTPDLRRDGMLVGKPLFAKYPHANILSIDTAAAQALPGVEIVMTAKDLPGANGYGIMCPDKPVIAVDRVRYAGDPVALVAAVDEDTARRALELIKVEYEVLPAYDDPREAIKEDAVVIYENHPIAERGNLINTVKVDRGDVEKAFAEADVVIEGYYETPVVEHCYMERDICIAELDPVHGGITITSPMQAIYASKRCLAPIFGMPQNKVRCVTPLVGGGFGGKEDSVLDVASIAGVLAIKTGRTVCVELNRDEVFRTTGKRHATYIKHRIAAKKDGTITAVDSETILNKGSYVSMGGVKEPAYAVTMRTAAYAAGTYAVENAKARSYSVLTNVPYSCAFRGFGVPQITYAMENNISDLARALNMDQFEIRKKNMLKHGDRTIYGQVMKEERGLGLGECLDKLKVAMEWEKPIDRGTGHIRRGRGIGTFMYGTGIPLLFEGASCYCFLENDGTMNISIASTEMGQGLITVMSQMAAETMGITVDKVKVNVSDTATSPDGGPTVGSRSTVMVGNAVVNGCSTLHDRILSFAASKIFGIDKRDLLIADNMIGVDGKPETFIPLAQAITRGYLDQVPMGAVGTWYPPKPSFRDLDGQGTPMHSYAFGAHGIELEIDIETGEITVTKSILAVDVGKAINPNAVEGQMDGGAAQGIGWSIMEETFMRDGVMENPSFHNFLIPTTKDLPKLESIIVEHPNELGPFGAKGVGEPPLIGAAPAIRNAIFDATGLIMNTIPYTPVRVIEAIKEQGGVK